MKSSLMNDADNVVGHGQTRNSNAFRNCRVAVISEYFEKLELESERTRLLSRNLFLPVNVTIFNDVSFSRVNNNGLYNRFAISNSLLEKLDG